MTPGSNIPLSTTRVTVDVTAPVRLDVSSLLLTGDGKVRSDDDFIFYNQEITITGSMAVLHSFERAAELFANGVLDPEIFISDRIELERYPQALEQFAAGVGRKIVVVP